MKLLVSILFILLCINCFAIGNTNDDGQSSVYVVKKIVFQNNQILMVGQNDSILGQEEMSKVRSIVFCKDADIEPVSESSIKVFPNPTKDILYIKCTGDSQIQVFDSNGRCVVTTFGESLDVSSFANGIYYLRINNQIYKFIKQ